MAGASRRSALVAVEARSDGWEIACARESVMTAVAVVVMLWAPQMSVASQPTSAGVRGGLFGVLGRRSSGVAYSGSCGFRWGLDSSDELSESRLFPCARRGADPTNRIVFQ